jgi:hypothetical protein
MMRAVMRSLSSCRLGLGLAAFRARLFFQRLMAHCHWRAVAASVLPPQSFRMPVTSSLSRMRELRFEAQHRAVLAQHAHAQRVKGADQHLFGRLAHQPLGALAHFGGGLVGEGDGGDALGRPGRSGSAARSCA